MALDDETAIALNGAPVSLRHVLGTALFFQTKDKLPDKVELLKEIQLNPTGGFPTESVHLFEKIARIGIHLTALHDLATTHDEISSNNVLSSECSRTYSAIVNNLRSLHYPVMEKMDKSEV